VPNVARQIDPFDRPDALVDRKAEAPRGGTTWNQVTVMRAMKRLGIASAVA
jgi:hypothetical protein